MGATASGSLASPDGGDAKPADDTRERRLIGRGGGGGDRYPIGCRITFVNDEGASYDCVEVDSDGVDISPEIEHLAVNNIGTAVLSVEDKISLFFNAEDESFFFSEQIIDYIIKGYLDGVKKIELEVTEIWSLVRKELSITSADVTSHRAGGFFGGDGLGSSVITDLTDVYGQMELLFDLSGANNSSITDEAFPGVEDILDAGISTLSFNNSAVDLTYNHKCTREDESYFGVMSFIFPGITDPINDWLRIQTTIQLNVAGGSLVALQIDVASFGLGVETVQVPINDAVTDINFDVRWTINSV
jgi:hypothetical protein